jgi:hypothetical protein
MPEIRAKRVKEKDPKGRKHEAAKWRVGKGVLMKTRKEQLEESRQLFEHITDKVLSSVPEKWEDVKPEWLNMFIMVRITQILGGIEWGLYKDERQPRPMRQPRGNYYQGPGGNFGAGGGDGGGRWG